MLQPTIRSALSRDTVTDYPLCSTLSLHSTSDYLVYRLSMLQPTIRSALSRDTATDYPLSSTLSVDSTRDYLVYPVSMF